MQKSTPQLAKDKNQNFFFFLHQQNMSNLETAALLREIKCIDTEYIV